jgi:hypothetical protein
MTIKSVCVDKQHPYNYTQLSIIRDNGGDGNHDQSRTRLRQILLKRLKLKKKKLRLSR